MSCLVIASNELKALFCDASLTIITKVQVLVYMVLGCRIPTMQGGSSFLVVACEV